MWGDMDKIYFLYNIERKLYINNLEPLAFFVRAFIRIFFAGDIPYKCKIGQGTTFPHDALGVVLHPDVVIGNNCKILHNVTIGGRSGFVKLPRIGNNVLVGTGVCILGDVSIGDNSIIGAGSVVLNNVPTNSVVVGVPGKIIKINTN